MFYYPPNNQYIQEGTPFTINDIQYPANWLNLSTPEEKSNLGLEEVITVNSPKDQRYYWVSEELSGATLTYINTPKDLEQCRTTAISQINSTAYSLLFPSDWMVTRSIESGVVVPQEWTTYRESIRQTANALKLQYSNCATVDELIEVIVEWPVSPDQPIIASANNEILI